MPLEETQLSFDSTPPPPPPEGEPEAEESQEPTLAELQAQIAETQRLAAEAKREAEHQAALRKAAEERAQWWEERKQAQAPPPREQEQAEDWGDPLEWFESNDPEERKRNFAAFTNRVNQTIERKAQQIAAEISRQQIEATTRQMTALEQHFQRLPDLRDPNSEIFQLSSRYGQEMKADPRYANLDASIIAERAIERAEIELLRAGKLGQAEPAAAPPPDYTQQRRQAMQQSQQPSMGRR